MRNEWLERRQQCREEHAQALAREIMELARQNLAELARTFVASLTLAHSAWDVVSVEITEQG